MFQQIVNVLMGLSLLQWCVFVIIYLATHALLYLAFARWLLRRQWHLFHQLKRPLVVIHPQLETGQIAPGGELSSELRLLRDSKLFNVPPESVSYKMFNPTTDHCVVVLGYKEGMAGLDDVLTKVKGHHVPLIVYTYGVHMPPADKLKIDAYPYVVYANFPLTLLNNIFATVASYSYESR